MLSFSNILSFSYQVLQDCYAVEKRLHILIFLLNYLRSCICVFICRAVIEDLYAKSLAKLAHNLHGNGERG